MAEFEQPIRVTDTILPTVAATALRQIVLVGTSFAIGKGWIDADNVEGIVTLALALATVIWGLYQSRKRKSQLITTADAAPASVAVLVGSSVGTLGTPREP